MTYFVRFCMICSLLGRSKQGLLYHSSLLRTLITNKRRKKCGCHCWRENAHSSLNSSTSVLLSFSVTEYFGRKTEVILCWEKHTTRVPCTCIYYCLPTMSLIHWTSLYRALLVPPLDIRHGTPAPAPHGHGTPAGDIWWPYLCKLFHLRIPPPVLTSGGHQSTYGCQAGGARHIGMLSFFIKEAPPTSPTQIINCSFLLWI